MRLLEGGADPKTKLLSTLRNRETTTPNEITVDKVLVQPKAMVIRSGGGNVKVHRSSSYGAPRSVRVLGQLVCWSRLDQSPGDTCQVLSSRLTSLLL
ncbi:hypothetical protein MPTK1_5g03590 [Marchantia polymorpha subsp. ruderalis]|uniref:Uncharacterized protein n=2 Tax=Marchantia polymorpha TaxID=3197 RepID=A0AAF6BEK7_MARPO|nr:hypothetical protein MARPO_0133s0028 [Marchantia polymorpha]BBN10441.1 hypothetical protein Mp_5g03590 [Marchantia polymorpha subsp. ruderalis]|eukprot:PTQ29881.1 hypothetical protein MARPO_0133s0028 [Marchantia polymorpha]